MTVNTRRAVGPTHLPIQQAPICFNLQNDGGLHVITDFHIVLRLRMSGAILLLPPYGFVAWIRTLRFTFYLLDDS